MSQIGVDQKPGIMDGVNKKHGEVNSGVFGCCTVPRSCLKERLWMLVVHAETRAGTTRLLAQCTKDAQKTGLGGMVVRRRGHRGCQISRATIHRTEHTFKVTSQITPFTFTKMQQLSLRTPVKSQTQKLWTTPIGSPKTKGLNNA